MSSIPAVKETNIIDSWFHFLCKNIPVEEVGGRKRIVNKNKRDAKDLSQADFSWIRFAYCLKIKAATQTGGWPEVTMILFGRDPLLWKEFKTISSTTSWQEIIEDPYCLFGPIFEVLYCRIDTAAWDLASVFSQEEEVGHQINIFQGELCRVTQNTENSTASGTSSFYLRSDRLCWPSSALQTSDLPLGSNQCCYCHPRVSARLP